MITFILSLIVVLWVFWQAGLFMEWGEAKGVEWKDLPKAFTEYLSERKHKKN